VCVSRRCSKSIFCISNLAERILGASERYVQRFQRAMPRSNAASDCGASSSRGNAFRCCSGLQVASQFSRWALAQSPTDIPMSVFSRVSTSRNESSFVGGYLRHGERFAAWFTGQSWWTLEDDERRQGKKEKEKEREGERERERERERLKKRRRETTGEEEGKEETGRGREGTFFLVAGAEEEDEGLPCAPGRERGEENVVLCSSRCRSSSPGSFLRRGQRPTKPRSRLRCRLKRV